MTHPSTLTGTLTVLAPDGTTTSKPVPVDCLGDLRDAVGGTVGLVSDFDFFERKGCRAYMRGDGAPGLPANLPASALWHARNKGAGMVLLHGAVAIVTGSEDYMEDLDAAMDAQGL